MLRTDLRAVYSAIDYAELAALNLSPEEIIDFTTNSNPYGPSPTVYNALNNVPIERYPDRDCQQLREAILAYEVGEGQVPLSAIVCGNGVNELVWVVAATYLRPGDKVAIIGPTFEEYKVACRGARAQVIELRATEEMQFQPEVMRIGRWIQEEQPHMVWLCNPNNPTGTVLGADELFRIARRCQRVGAILVIDESYYHFVFPAERVSAIELLQKQRDLQLIILRSMTKDFALAGLRLGYVLASETLVPRLRAHLPAWNVSSLAQVGGIAAVQDRGHLQRSLQSVQRERQLFLLALQSINGEVVPSRTHFCLVKVQDAREVRLKLLREKVLVRDCAMFGLPEYIRIGVRSRSDWQQLIQAMRKVL